MKAISIRQPWAWAILYAGKNVENRSWRTKYRGPILIHAGQKFDYQGYEWIWKNRKELGCKLPVNIEPFQRGGIIGKVDVVDCVRHSFGRWVSGPYAWMLENPEPLPFKKMAGKLSLFNVD